MTPEQENELVARWMGWARGGWDGDPPEFSQWSRILNGVKNYYVGLPPYRTDPALLWELMLKLHMPEHGWWCFRPYYDGEVRGNSQDPPRDVFLPSMAEAVFAAAVMQSEQEGK